MKLPFLALLLLFVTGLFASAQYEVTHHKDITKFIKTKGLDTSPSDLLVVYDIDNTVLAMNKNFGSDQWFNWQREELKFESSDSLARSFKELLDIQYQIVSLSQMHLTETSVKPIIDSFQRRGVATIALTSRGPESRNSTQRELQRQGVDFSKTSIGQSIGDKFIPRGQERYASFQSGVFMTSGMHKGQMLKYILNKFSKSYKYIVFIDDHKKHTTRVFETFSKSNSQIYTFRYAGEDKNVETFKDSNKSESKDLGHEFMALRKSLY